MSEQQRPVTNKKDLRTGTPLWLRHGNVRVPSAPLKADLRIDVAVVGAGVSGALVADALSSGGMSVAIIDRRGPVKGSSPASTGLLQFDLDEPLIHLARKLGRERASRAYWRSASAVEMLQARIADLGLRCGFRERQAIYLPGNVLNIAGLKREAEARQKIGLRSVFIGADELHKLTGIVRAGAILSPGAGEVDPAALVGGLLRAVLSRGGQIYAPTDIVDVDPGRTHVTLTTREGHTIRAKHVVFATGYELVKLVKNRRFQIRSTWALATKPQPAKLWKSRCLIWEAADPYLYLRTTPDGRAIIGGEDDGYADDDRRDAQTPVKIERIRRKTAKLLPQLDTRPDFSWAGCFGESASGLPAMGAIPGAARCYAVAGYGGNGITFSVIAAQIIQRAIIGIADPDAAVFGFT
jgi:glycine/D-amino acid oxidase-like deaminating enzyme